MIARRSHVAALALLLLAGAAIHGAQQAPPGDAATPTLESVQARIDELQKLDADGTIDDEGKSRLALYRQAHDALRQASAAAEQRGQHEQAIAQAPAEIETVRAEVAQPSAEAKPQPAADATLAQLQQSLEQAQADLKAAQDKLKEIESEPKRREGRLTEIPQQIASGQNDLEELERELAALPRPEESPALTEARWTELSARRRLLQEQLGAWDKERQRYEARRELLPLRRERWQRRATQNEALVAAWQQLVDGQRAREIQQQKREAGRAAARAHPQVAPIADENLGLTRRRDELRPESERAQERLAQLRPDPDDLKRQLQSIEEKIEAVGLTSTVGLLLRTNRANLPDLRLHRRNIKQRQATMADLEFERLDYEDRHDDLLANTERTVQDILARLDPGLTEDERKAIEEEARNQLRTKRQFLEDINGDLTLYFNRLEALNQKEQQIVELTEQIADFIDERILWIRSAAPIPPAAAPAALDALAWLASPTEWTRLGRAAWSDARPDLPLIVTAAVAFAGLLALRVWLRKRIRWIAQRVARPRTDTFGRSIEATAITLVRALVWPVILWSVSAWLSHAAGASELELTGAIAAGLSRAGAVLFIVMLTRELCRPKGLGEAHFRWRPRTVRLVRRQLAWFSTIAVAASFVTAAMLAQSSNAYESSLGRIAYIAGMVATAVFLHRLVRPTGGILEEFLKRHDGGWVDRLRYIWYPLLVLAPLALAVMAASGYFYTAAQLVRQLAESALLILFVLVVYGLLLRWLFIAQRKLAWEEARKRAAEAEAERAAGTGGAAGGPPPVPVEEKQLDITAIGAQTRQLLNGLTLFAILIGFWGIWVDAFPAIGFLRGIELWQMGEAAAAVAPAEEGAAAAAPPQPDVQMVTLADLLVAFIILIVTVIVSKNIPGLLEITILQRLPFEPGGRYAVTTILRYTISIVGVVIAFSAIGVTWAKVQWIAAAITVGLGFGLQEIFGNFVSGLIILFERPIRVGDTVTVGETSGTVTRIRIRATTVTDWDRKELVIPNKEFVTAKIVNWSLSDPILRISVGVGIAYGSDTAKATRLLLEAARANPHVLEEPAPRALFMGFGESSLDFALRVFIPNIDYFLSTKSELHETIDQAFRKEGIEIAFPQRDLHVRTFRAGVPVDVSMRPDADEPPRL